MIRTKLLGIACFSILSTALAQQAGPQTPEDAFTTRDLIAWSQLQKPQPAPQPLPPRESPVPQPEQPRDQQAKPPADAHIEQEPAQWFTGKIVKEGKKYVLLLAGNTRYQMEEDSRFEAYEAHNVRVLGILNTGNNTIHPVNVQLLT